MQFQELQLRNERRLQFYAVMEFTEESSDMTM